MAEIYCPNIGRAIEENGLSQKEVAISLDVSRPTVSDWVNGKKTPTIKNLFALADICKTSPAYLLGCQSLLPVYVKFKRGNSSIVDFAQRIGVSEQVIKTAENHPKLTTGKSCLSRALSNDDLSRIADALGVSYEFVACLQDGINPALVAGVEIPDDWGDVNCTENQTSGLKLRLSEEVKENVSETKSKVKTVLLDLIDKLPESDVQQLLRIAKAAFQQETD